MKVVLFGFPGVIEAGALTAEAAVDLAEILGTSPKIWMNAPSIRTREQRFATH